ncbi:hypothetical protein JXQ31_04410 [candidate division KSB1 bacterium]|nr:hypothetical protein [candidate division KSB1 bacterium]
MSECNKIQVYDQDGKYIRGCSDFKELPVYQTKLLKISLKSPGVDDQYDIPRLPDNYPSLFCENIRNFNWILNPWSMINTHISAECGIIFLPGNSARSATGSIP